MFGQVAQTKLLFVCLVHNFNSQELLLQMLIALPKVLVKPNIDKKLQVNRDKVKHLRHLVNLVARNEINAKAYKS